MHFVFLSYLKWRFFLCTQIISFFISKYKAKKDNYCKDKVKGIIANREFLYPGVTTGGMGCKSNYHTADDRFDVSLQIITMYRLFVLSQCWGTHIGICVSETVLNRYQRQCFIMSNLKNVYLRVFITNACRSNRVNRYNT